MRKISFMFLSLLLAHTASAQDWVDNDNPGKLRLGKNIEYNVEMQGSFSSEQTPLWLNANKYGLSSLEKINGYVRGSLIRPLQTDSARRWGVGYGVDVAAAYHYTSIPIIQQAFVEGRWLHGVLTVGSKEYPMELKNPTLSSGSQTLGINARPVPQVRIALPDYWRLPFGGGWLHLKGHIAYGRMTDERWQHEFTQKQDKYADGVLYHSKAGYLKIGNSEVFSPWSLELGLEMACTFGGKAHSWFGNELVLREGGHGLKDFWHAFLPGGADAGEGLYGNIEGNQLGSWVARFNYDGEDVGVSLYGDHYFEDHSQMLLIDYNGYGTGEEWNVHKERRYFLYKLKDMMLGAELNLKRGWWLRHVVFEYIYTKYQSGPYNHDRTKNISDHIAGMDNYYNHYIYTGWQHWGQVIGNPLYRSPIYNTDGVIDVRDNRFMAFHLGFDGDPTERLHYRVLATWQEGLGTYYKPYTKKHHNVSVLAEAAYRFNHGWQVKGGLGMDFGAILGNTQGFQLTISKKGVFNL